ncbi:hypothetical protein [Sphingomonas sp. R86521]|uniref:hypothetical protein n=1 Tax=Sphingomonas sp. R86521 TaxID=3093860 RepID=UPI0036D39A54
MTSPTAEDRLAISAGLQVLREGGIVGKAEDRAYRLSNGISVAELPVEHIFDDRPLSALVPTGRRFLGVSDETVSSFDLSYDSGEPRLVRTFMGHRAEATLETIANTVFTVMDDLVVVRVRGTSAEGLWVRDTDHGIVTIVPAEGATEDDDFIEACRRLIVAKRDDRGNE